MLRAPAVNRPRVPVLLAALGGLVSSVARADSPPPVSRTGAYSRYERETIEMVSRDRKLELDPAPEDKVIEAIDVVSLDVIEPRDPVPGILNLLHHTSRPHVIRRESLLQVGEPYRKVLADETARNLRRYSQLSLVLVLPVRGSAPDRVRLTIVTKDTWSLRLNWDAAFSSGGLERLVLAPTETNLLGYQHTVGAQLSVLPASFETGLRYSIPRVLGSRIAASAATSLIVRREGGHVEGSSGGVSIGQSLFSTRTPWAWNVGASWRNEIVRRYVNASLAIFDSPLTDRPGDLPFLYRSNTAAASASVTRSLGWALKNDFTLALDYTRRHYSVPSARRQDPVALADFRRRYVPTSDDRLSPSLQWQTYRTDFLRTIDLDSLGLQEDVRLGHLVTVRVYPSSSHLGSTRTVFGLAASAAYTQALGDGYARVSASSITEWQPDRLSDGSLTLGTHIATPLLPFGRFVLDATMLNRYRNYLNRTSSLGGDGRLRGWRTGELVGDNLVAYNVEARSRPVQVLSCQLGGVLFYDAGATPDTLRHLDMKQSLGGGLRALFPQLDRVVFRADLGFPIQAGGLPRGVNPVNFFFAFGQALDAL